MNKFFPIGTILKIYNIKQPVMIIGYLQQVKDKVYEYLCVPYPTGLISESSTLAFDSGAIEGVVSEGYKDSDTEMLLEAIPKILSGINEILKGEQEV